MKERKKKYKYWKASEIEAVRAAYVAGKTLKQIASEMGLTHAQVDGVTNRHKLNCGRSGQFKPGHRSWNKGKSVRLNPKNEFKKGHLPHHTKFDGAISRRRDKNGKVYQFIRISLGVWKPLHVHVWEQVNGSVPAGMLVVFKDRNTLNTELSNLQLITRRENLVRNYNRKKASESMRETWRIEKLRKDYGLSPKTGLAKRMERRKEVCHR